MSMREDCRHFASRIDDSGEAARFCVLGLALTYLAPPVLTIFSRGPAQLMAAVAWALMTLSFAPVQRFYDLSPWRALTLPLVATLYGAFTIESAIQHERGRGGTWKGRAQALDGSRI